MEYKELTSPSLTGLFVKEITRMILSGQLKPGDKLIPEREMASKMKVSVTVVHSGIRKLEQQGFVRVVPRVGTYVEDFAKNGTIETMAALIEYSEDHFLPDFLVPMFQLLIQCEPIVMKEVCKNRTLEQLHGLEETVSKMQASTQHDEAAAYAFEFHHDLAAASNVMAYPILISSMKKIFIFGISASYSTMSIDRHCQYFRDVLDAVFQRDDKKATDILIKSMTERMETERQAQAEKQSG